MYKILSKQAKDSEQKVIQLSKNVEMERKNFLEKLAEIKSKYKSKDKNLVSDIDKLHQRMSSGIANLIFDYAEEKSKDDQLFFNRLLEAHPNLTPGDLRLCFLISTNLTTKEIAEKHHVLLIRFEYCVAGCEKSYPLTETKIYIHTLNDLRQLPKCSKEKFC